MALTRKFCEEIGLTAEQTDSVLAEHGKSISQAKNSATGEVESLKTEIESLKADNSELKAAKEKAESAVEKVKLDAAIDAELVRAGAYNPMAVKPFLSYDGISFDKDGKLKGLGEQLGELTANESYLFKSAEKVEAKKEEPVTEAEKTDDEKPSYKPQSGSKPTPKSFGARLAEKKLADAASKTESQKTESLWR